MKKHIKPSIYVLLFSQIAIFVISLILYRNISLLHYINLSFYLSLLCIMFSLTIFTINTGFFDVTDRSFRRLLFAKRGVSKEHIEQIRPLSEMITFNYLPLLISGILTFTCMLTALFFYYL